MLIIGYGNTLRGDDGIGVYAAQQLGEVLAGVDVVLAHQLTPELVEPVSRAETVIFIDAQAGGQPGAITCRRLEPLASGSAFTHTVTPEGLLAGAHLLYGAQPQGYLYTVNAVDFEYGEALSPPVQAALPVLVTAITRFVQGDSAAESDETSTLRALQSR